MAGVCAKKKTKYPQIPQINSAREGGRNLFTLLINILQLSQKENLISVVVSL